MTGARGFAAALVIGILGVFPALPLTALFGPELQLPVLGVMTVMAGLLAGVVTRGVVPTVGLAVGYGGSWAAILAYSAVTLPYGDPGLGLFFGALIAVIQTAIAVVSFLTARAVRWLTQRFAPARMGSQRS